MTAKVQQFEVGGGDVGRRLDAALADWLGESRSQSVRRVDRGEVLVDDREVARSWRLQFGERVDVVSPPVIRSVVPDVPPIMWEDEYLLVVNKPAGLVVHPGSGRPDGTLVDALRAVGMPLAAAGDPARPGIVHRLDLGTSGLMLVAKTVSAHQGLSGALRRREIERLYLALAAGELPAHSGRIDVPLGRDPRVKVRFIGDHDGKRAVTHWVVLDRVGPQSERLSLVACRLETGRTHQIRAHLRHVHAPVVGDTRYGGPSVVAGDTPVDRPLLHAARLAFDHPVTGERIEIDVDPPEDMARILRLVSLKFVPLAEAFDS